MSFDPREVRVPAGSVGGGRWGGGGSGSKANAPRDAAAAKAQANPKAKPMFDKATSLPPKDRAKYVQGLSDADLELLTQALYSAKTSDPTVVQSRITAANEMSKRGLDIKKFGAQGGASPAAKSAAPTRKVTPAQHKVIARAQARKAAAKPAASSAAQAAATTRAGSQVHGAMSVRAE